MRCKNCKTILSFDQVYYCNNGIMQYKASYKNGRIELEPEKFKGENDGWWKCRTCGAVLSDLTEESLVKKILKKGGAKK